jgi:hypothetical protein
VAVEKDLGNRLDDVDLDALAASESGRHQVRLEADLITIWNDRSRQSIWIIGRQKTPL